MVQRQAAAISARAEPGPKGHESPEGVKARAVVARLSKPSQRKERGNPSRRTFREEIERIAGTELRHNGVSQLEITAFP